MKRIAIAAVAGALFGLGGSGLVTAEALVAGGARVVAWDDAEATAAELARLSLPEAVSQVIALERRLIAVQDSGRHSVASALPPPARRPHVTHQRRDPGRGEGLFAWLRRLFGRR